MEAVPTLLPVLSDLDDTQTQALAALDAGRHVIVTGAPRTGRTSLALEAARYVGRVPGRRVVVVTPTRARRDLLEASPYRADLPGAYPILTPAALAFRILSSFHTDRARPLMPPTLMTGADEDALVAHFIEQLPPPVEPETAETSYFRVEIRNLIARCGDFHIDGPQLEALGREWDIPLWQWVSRFLDEWGVGDRLDSARSQDAACALLREWETRADEERVGAQKPRYDLVVVDDIHDMTPASRRLVAQLAADGSQILATTCPEQAVDIHRGAWPANAEELAADLKDRPLTRLVARTRHGEAADVDVRVFGSEFDEADDVAVTLTRTHLYGGVDYADMAVIVRTNALMGPLERRLSAAGIPLANPTARLSWLAEPVSESVLALITVAGLEPDDDAATEPACALLRGPLVGLADYDAARLARYVRSGDPGFGLPGLADLVPVLTHPQEAETLAKRAPADVADAARLLWEASELLAHARELRDRPVGEGLASLWSATKLEQRWVRESRGPGRDARAANDALDVVVALFRVADFFAQSHPDATLAQFADDLAHEEVPRDTVSALAQRAPGVYLLTPQTAAGRSFDTVIIAGLQEDTWPRIRLRDTLSRSGLLTDIATGRLLDPGSVPDIQADYAAERRNERRAFRLACERARRRLVLTAIDDRDHSPGIFLIEAWTRQAETATGGEQPLTPPHRQASAPLGPRALIARARRGLAEASLEGRPLPDTPVRLLALMALAGHEPAHPRSWTGLAGAPRADAAWWTTTRPLAANDHPVSISPSVIDTALRCPLKWLLTRHGGDRPSGEANAVGLIIHTLAEEWATFADREEFEARLAALWESTVPGRTWIAERNRLSVEQRAGHLYDFLAGRHASARVEVPVSAQLGKVRISARLDRVEHGDDGPAIIDFKTGSTASLREAAYSPQLAAYQLAYEAACGDIASGASLVYVHEDKIVHRPQRPLSASLDATASNRDKRTVAEAVADTYRQIGAEETQALTQPGGLRALAHFYIEETGKTCAGSRFVAYATDSSCRSCPVKASCPATDGERTLS